MDDGERESENLQGSREKREHVTGDDGKWRDEDLATEGEGIEGRRYVRRYAQRHEHREELPEVACRLKHGFDEAADIAATISLLPCWHGWSS